MRDPLDDINLALKPKLLGGAISYTVDISAMDCGCVAGLYAVRTSDKCSNEPIEGMPQCHSISLMQANHGGFNVAAHPCKNGKCDAIS